MTEVDIWIKVLNKLGFKLIDEYCGPGDINQLEYSSDKDVETLRYKTSYILYFNRKTEKVNSFSVSCPANSWPHGMDVITKQSFYNQYIDVFREVKLENLV